MDIAVVLATVAFVLVVLLVIVYLSIRVVQQYERMVVFRLGRTDQAMVRNPGLNFLIPVVDRPIKVDLRENLTEVPSQRTITRDNAPITDVASLGSTVIDTCAVTARAPSSAAGPHRTV